MCYYCIILGITFELGSMLIWKRDRNQIGRRRFELCDCTVKKEYAWSDVKVQFYLITSSLAGDDMAVWPMVAFPGMRARFWLGILVTKFMELEN